MGQSRITQVTEQLNELVWEGPRRHCMHVMMGDDALRFSRVTRRRHWWESHNLFQKTPTVTPTQGKIRMRAQQ